jgi:hypothetical protein
MGTYYKLHYLIHASITLHLCTSVSIADCAVRSLRMHGRCSEHSSSSSHMHAVQALLLVSVQCHQAVQLPCLCACNRRFKALIDHSLHCCMVHHCTHVCNNRFVVVDLLPDEAGQFVEKCRASELSFIPLVSPTTTDGT